MNVGDRRSGYAFSRAAIPSWIALGILWLLFCAHLAAVWIHAVDIPVQDEFGVFLSSSQYFEKTFDWEWLFKRHNEHRIVLSRLQGWLLYRLDGWNLVTHQVMNFFLYGFVLATILWISRRLQPGLPLWAIVSFVIFMLSPLGHVNHAWGLQSHLHFTMLFFLLASWLLFSEPQHPMAMGSGVACVWLAMNSQAGGAVACLVLSGCYLLFKGLRVYETPAGPARRRELVQGLLIVVALGAGFAFWFMSLSFGRKTLLLPWTFSFWNSLTSLVSYGFGYTAVSVVWGGVCLLVVLMPIVGHFWRSRGRPEASFWIVSTVLLGILLIVVSIAFGRGALKGPRYFQLVALLPPFTFLAWYTFLADRHRLRVVVSVVLWLVCAYGYKDHLSLAVYERTEMQRRANEARVRDYYHGVGPVPTELILRRPLAAYLENARRLKVSFAERLSLPTSTPPPDRNGPDEPIGFLAIAPSGLEVVGWALDPDTPSRPIEVRFYVGGRADSREFIGSAIADVERRDVTQAMGYQGNHGFRFLIPSAFHDGEPHTLHAYAVDSASGQDSELSGSGFLFTISSENRRPIGFINSINEVGVVTGWALDPDSPTEPVTIHFHLVDHREKKKFSGRATADRLRLDVNQVTGMPGNHGFQFRIPKESHDGKPRKLYVHGIDLAGGRNSLLSGSGADFQAK